MKIKLLTALLTMIFSMSLSTAVIADVPPDAGYKRIQIKLIVDPAEDFADHRFFLKIGPEIREFELIKGKQLVIESKGGGAYYRSGKFLAIAKKDLSGLSEESTDDRLNPMQRAIYDGKVPGAIDLIPHSFIRDVPIAEAAGYKDPTFRLEKDAEKGIRAVQTSGGGNEPKGVDTQGSYYSTDPKSGGFWTAVIGGSLLTFAFICIGVLFIRRSKMKDIKLDPTI